LCHRFAGSDAHKFGTVRDGIDREAQTAFLQQHHIADKTDCSKCWARPLCSGGCYHEAHVRYGTTQRPNLHYCEWIRGWTDVCLQIYGELSERNPAFLAQFDEPMAAERVSYIPEENPALQGLAQVNQDVVRELGRRCAEQKIATLDVDATIIESWKREAKPTYEGCTGYQPVLALWAEMSVVVADEFRDGNVPAQQALLPITQRAFQALPETVVERYFRGDSACHEQSLLEWLRDEQRAGGPQGRIGFAVSARMNPALHAEIAAALESRWQPYGENSIVIKECCEVDYVPEETGNPYREPLRYVAIRIRKKQQALFADGSTVKYFAVVSNVWEWTPKRLLEWHREKAGSIEAVHDVIKNELAGGVMPCGRFGANAAWLRLAVLTYNVLTALKRLALPPELLMARPKRLRFLIFNTPGKLVHHARRTLLRLGWTWQRFSNWQGALRLLPLPG